MPPQMKTFVPMAAEAAFSRATNPTGAAAVALHLGVQVDVLQVRPTPQLLPQPPQLAASLVGSTHLELQAILGAVHTSVMH